MQEWGGGLVGTFVADLWPSPPPGPRVSFTLGRAEFLGAVKQSYLADPQYRRAVVAVVIGLILGTVLTALGIWVGIALIAVDGAMLAVLIYCYLGLPIRSWKTLENNRLQQTYEFSPEGVTEQLANHTAFVKWSVFTRVVEARDFYVFLVRGRRAIFLPKRAFTSAADQETYRELVRAHAPYRFRNP